MNVYVNRRGIHFYKKHAHGKRLGSYIGGIRLFDRSHGGKALYIPAVDENILQIPVFSGIIASADIAVNSYSVCASIGFDKL